MRVEHGSAWAADRTVVRFPDPAIEVLDERFRALIVGHEVVERLWTGGRWLEGPVWFGDGRYLLFSDIPNDRMLRWDEATGEVVPFRQPAGNSNGNTRDRQGRLVTCEHLARRVTRTEYDGSVSVLMDAFDGKRLNAPNDVTVHSDGSVWFGDGRYLLFSDIPNDRMLRWDEATGEVVPFRQPAGNSNGNTRDRQGRLVTCEHLARRVTRTEYDGSVSVLMDAFDGKRLNAPNDVTVHSDSSVWFTDPGYGIGGNYEGDKAAEEIPRHVFRIDPGTGVGEPVISGMERPNGLCFSPDESLLYVVDVGHIRVFDMVAGRPVNGRVFIEMSPGGPDGVRTDTDGNVWASAGDGGAGFDGVHCYAPDGTLLGQIHLPETCANLCFGGVKKNRLFITASRSLYSVYVEALGAQRP